nr:hypothetical protein [Pseudomonas mendocina]
MGVDSQECFHRVSLDGVSPFEDLHGNKVLCEGLIPGLKVVFHGRGNVLQIASGSRPVNTTIEFHGDGGWASLGNNFFKGFIRIGGGSGVSIGDGVTCTERAFIAASEGAVVKIGDDCMLATGNQIRTDDVHAIYDVRSGERLNPAKNITIGNHVWLALGVKVLGGV